MVQRGDQAEAEGVPRRPIYKDLVLLQLVALVFLADQLTKTVVRGLLDLRESFPAEGFFRFTHTFNTGSAFGLFQNQNLPLILVSFVGVAVLVFIYRSQRRPSNLLRLSLGFQFGGAAGNLLDRVRLGHVTDFVDVGSWPIFNLADASIVIGLVLLAWLFLAPDSRSRKGPEIEATGAALGESDEATVIAEHTSINDSAGSSPSSAGPDGLYPRPRDASSGPSPGPLDDPFAEGGTPEGPPPHWEEQPGSRRATRPPVEE